MKLRFRSFSKQTIEKFLTLKAEAMAGFYDMQFGDETAVLSSKEPILFLVQGLADLHSGGQYVMGESAKWNAVVIEPETHYSWVALRPWTQIRHVIGVKMIREFLTDYQ